MEFKEFLDKVIARDKPNWKIPFGTLAIDPGETTGWAYFNQCGELQRAGQIISKEQFTSLTQLFEMLHPTDIVVEDYRIYPQYLKAHTWSALFTPKLIGAIEYICWERKIKLHFQMAGTVKSFCSDVKLKEWGLWLKGKPHSRDALRHICYWLLFGKDAK